MASRHLLLGSAVPFFFFAAISSSSTAPIQLLALLSLKSALHDPAASLRNWTYFSISTSPSSYPTPPWCSWPGVTCSATLRSDVAALDLSSRNLSGHLPPELLLLSSTLVSLNLSNNAFSGRLPPVIFQLRRLTTLDISRNNFSSDLPAQISDLRHLAVFDAFSNGFVGPIPPEIAGLRSLHHLNLGGSYFTGSIPQVFGNLLRLRYLNLAGNSLSGRLPDSLANLQLLEHLEIGYNGYDGGVPPSFARLSRLRYLDISSANLSGMLPLEIAALTRLESLFMFKNRLVGPIPGEFSAMTALKAFDLSDNRLNGSIPASLAALGNLTLLSLMGNKLSGSIPDGIAGLPQLEVVNLWNNSLSGHLPAKLGWNQRLVRLDASTNYLSGPIPPALCAGNQLSRLILFSNRLNSTLPANLANCTSLWRVRLENNQLTGPIPAGLGSLPNLTYMDLSSNSLSGGIPPDLGMSQSMEYLNVSNNPLRHPLPSTIWNGPGLQIFAASDCNLGGEIPGFGPSGCSNLYKIEIAGNSLAGSVPSDIGLCRKLTNIRLDRNRLTGGIPPVLAALPLITELNLSSNGFVGEIPPEFSNCTTLESFDVSFNGLTGQVPSTASGTWSMQPWAFVGNAGLCGVEIRRPCTGKHISLAPEGAALMWTAAMAVAAAGLVVMAVMTRCVRWQEPEIETVGGKQLRPRPQLRPWRMMAFQKLSFSSEDVVKSVLGNVAIIGEGSTSTVYRAKMPSGEVVAVKKLRPPSLSAKAEVDVLGSVRHRNIVRLLGWCSDGETALLIYEYMPNGSLEELLHGWRDAADKGQPDWEMRYKIAVGVAQGMSYLHHDCQPKVVHRDLKPSNILLDTDMEARVADFGTAKLIHHHDAMSVVAGSCGYIAPEYAYTLRVDEKSDVYSYGVVLMEIVTGRKPVDPETYGEGCRIADWMSSTFQQQQAEEVLHWLLPDNDTATAEQERKEMMLILGIAVLCTSRNPQERPSMRDVLAMLLQAKAPAAAATAGGCGGGGKQC